MGRESGRNPGKSWERRVLGSGGRARERKMMGVGPGSRGRAREGRNLRRVGPGKRRQGLGESRPNWKEAGNTAGLRLG